MQLASRLMLASLLTAFTTGSVFAQEFYFRRSVDGMTFQLLQEGGNPGSGENEEEEPLESVQDDYDDPFCVPPFTPDLVGYLVCDDGAIYAGELNGKHLFAWHEEQGTIGTFSYGGNGQDQTGAKDMDDGYTNTAWLVNESPVTHLAAEACWNNGPGWYLPAANELLVLSQSSETGLFKGTYWTGAHWSSTGSSTTHAYLVNFPGGSNAILGGKNSTFRVRCVRQPTHDAPDGGQETVKVALKNSGFPTVDVDEPYNFDFRDLAIVSGPATVDDLSWAMTAEGDGQELPPGLSIGNDGVLTGVPTEEGTYSFTVTASYMEKSAQLTYSIRFSDIIACDPDLQIGGQCEDGSWFIGNSPHNGSRMFMTDVGLEQTLGFRSCQSTFCNLIGSPASTIDGMENTNFLVSQNSGSRNYPAGTYCAELEAYGYHDWYLPAGTGAGSEMDLLAQLGAVGGLTRNESTLYWSSTTSGFTAAYAQNLTGNDSGTSVSQDNNYQVRCVRREIP